MIGLKSIFSAIVVLLYRATRTERICTALRGAFLFRTALGVRLGSPIGSVYLLGSLPATLYTLFICSFKIGVIFVKLLRHIFSILQYFLPSASERLGICFLALPVFSAET